MIPLLLLLFLIEPLDTATPSEGQLLSISIATARTVNGNYPPEFAIDGDLNTFYHTGEAASPQWLKLQLEDPAWVSRVVIVNRLENINIMQRLLGTQVYLYDADGTTQIANCGKISTIASLMYISSQTYNMPCDSSQLASYVKLEDSEMEVSIDDQIIMNILEVEVYGTVPLSTGK
uniref:Putative secretory peptide-21 n=1 Tax=Pleurobrachia bachei TaxID=34499 RepID=M4H261_PLEBA|nr:putative secretory peptide-21 [Pleurobrachia bachei]|eukprot:sb/3471942/